jgi:DNA ligase-associated metallophosphoesterase
VRDQELCLSAERCIYWENQRALIVSDLHFGKTGHFRKAGIAVPQTVFKQDIQRLIALLQYFKPEQLIVVGDMFHSDANKELELFARWRADFENLTIRLVKGNHDILPKSWYTSQLIDVHDDSLVIDNFCFQHDPAQCSETESQIDPYIFSGHIHPGVTFNGLGKQSLRFPCFYFSDTHCVLPAFSHFTGFVNVQRNTNDVTFAIVNRSLVRV